MMRLSLLLGLLATGLAQAQENAPRLHDPTLPNQALRDILLNYRGQGGGAAPSATETLAWPKIALLGKIVRHDRVGAVILAIEGRTVQMRPGQVQTVLVDGELFSLKLLSVAPEGVQLQLVERNETIFLP